MSKAAEFRAEAAKRILVKDGAYGTLVQAEKLDGCTYGGDLGLSRDQRGNNDLLNLTCPKLVEEICERFADAGADMLATNTFNANAISQADYGAEHQEKAQDRVLDDDAGSVDTDHRADHGRHHGEGEQQIGIAQYPLLR